MGFKLFDKVSVWPEGRFAEICPYEAECFNSSNHKAVVIFVIPEAGNDGEKYVVSCVKDDDWDWFSVPESWLHEPEYTPPSNKFVIECKINSHTVYTVCNDYEPFDNILEAQTALNSHRSNWKDFDARLTYNGTVIG